MCRSKLYVLHDCCLQQKAEPHSCYTHFTPLVTDTEGTDKMKYMVASEIIQYFEQIVAELVKFAQKIPGFTSLSQKDQTSLITGEA